MRGRSSETFYRRLEIPNAEVGYYYDFLQGNLAILAQWQKVLREGMEERRGRRNTNVQKITKEIYRTPTGLIMVPRQKYTRQEINNPPLQEDTTGQEKLAVVTLDSMANPEKTAYNSLIEVKSGEPGKPLLMDLNGFPVDKVNIRIGSYLGGRDGILRMQSTNDTGWGKRGNNRHFVRYEGIGESLVIERGDNYTDPMTNDYAIDLLLKLDSIINGAQSVSTPAV